MTSMTGGTIMKISELPLFSFDLIMADPPWHFELRSEKGEVKSPQAHYKTMAIEEISALPIGQLASGDCYLFLWCTWPMLLGNFEPRRISMAVDSPVVRENADVSPVGKVIRAWGFRYVTGGTWYKKTVHGKASFGPGYVVRSTCEPFLIAKIGSPENSKSCRNLIEGMAREHSRKPESAYAWCETWMPDARKLDLFSRKTRPGWISAGDEAGKFDHEEEAQHA